MYLHSKFSKDQMMDFSKIKWEDFLPAAEAAKSLAENRVKQIKTNPASFENTIQALEEASREFTQVMVIFSTLVGVNKDSSRGSEIDEINEQLTAMSNDYESNVSFDYEIFIKVKEVYEHLEVLNPVEQQLTKNTYEGFIDSGVNLPKETQDKLRAINDSISELEIKIQSNLQEEPTHMKIEVSDEGDFKGLSNSFIKKAKENAHEVGTNGWVVKVNEATFSEVMDFAQHRPLRTKMNRMWRSRGMNKDAFDNTESIGKLLHLRFEQAKLLGSENPSSNRLKDWMVKKPEVAVNFLQELEKNLMPKAQHYANIIKTLAKKDGVEVVSQADEQFYKNLALKEMLDLDVSQIKYFLPYNKLWSGFQAMIQTLFNVKFERVSDASTWHSDVEVYRVTRGDTNIGLLYLDLFTRETKGSGAWMTYLNGSKEPHIVLVGNFDKATEDGTLLLKDLTEVETLFHEMGHGLHGFLSEVPYESMSGVNVAWDFVELPSQILENFIYEPEVLNLITGHYKTGEALPIELREKITQSKKLFLANLTLGYVGKAQLDLNLHMNEGTFNLKESDDFLDKFYIFERVAGTGITTNFSHSWGGGYESAYYSYFWAQMLDADCFAEFKKHGVLNKEVGERFRKEILSKGSSRDEMESFEKFMGRKPDQKAFIDRF